MLDKSKPDRWKSTVFYQVYSKSFQDTNGDSVGVLRGVIQPLDCLEKLGIDGVWLADPDSLFYFYQKLTALRKECPVFRGSEILLSNYPGSARTLRPYEARMVYTAL